MTANEPFGEFSLTPEELVLLVLCFRRALRLYETCVISSEAVFEFIELVTDAMDPQQPSSVAALRSTLEYAWRDAMVCFEEAGLR